MVVVGVKREGCDEDGWGVGRVGFGSYHSVGNTRGVSFLKSDLFHEVRSCHVMKVS